MALPAATPTGPAVPSGRKALRETLVLALTSNAGILANIVRMKILALAFGASGIGVFGLLQSIVGVGSIIGGLGIEAVAVRELAAARAANRDEEVHRLRSALAAAALAAGGAAGVLIAVFSPLLAWMLGLGTASGLVALTGVGVAASVASTMTTRCSRGIRQMRSTRSPRLR